MEVSLMGSLLVGGAAAFIIVTLAGVIRGQQREQGSTPEEPAYRVVRGKGYWFGMILALLFTSVPGMVLFHFVHYFSSRECLDTSAGSSNTGNRWEGDKTPDTTAAESNTLTLEEALPDYERYWMMGYDAHYAGESYNDSCGESNPLTYQAWRLGKEYAVKEIMEQAERRKKETNQK